MPDMMTEQEPILLTEQAGTPARARARACEAHNSLPIRVEEIQLPDSGEDQRTPRVWVNVALGPLVASFTVARRRRRQIEIRPPMLPDGGEGLVLPAELEAAVHAAIRSALEADSAAWGYLNKRTW